MLFSGNQKLSHAPIVKYVKFSIHKVVSVISSSSFHSLPGSRKNFSFYWNSFLRTSFGGSISFAIVCSVSSERSFIFLLISGLIQFGTCS